MSTAAVTTKKRTIFHPDGFQISWGQYIAGDVASLYGDDNDFLVTHAKLLDDDYFARVKVSHHTAHTAPYRLHVKVRTKYSMPQVQQCSIYDFDAGAWHLFSVAYIGETEKTISFTTADAASYIGADGEIRIRTRGADLPGSYAQSVERVAFTLDHD